MMNITVCGGGNLGHVCAGFLAAQDCCRVSLLTSSPSRWSSVIEVHDCKGQTFRGTLHKVSSHPEDVIPGADLVLLCLPGFAIREVLLAVRPCLSDSTWVGSVVSSTGFFFEALELLPASQVLFGFQRVPFIARTLTYGHAAELKGYKDSLTAAVEHSPRPEYVRTTLQQMFSTPVRLAGSYYEVSLSNSNPLLHPARLYTLWGDWKPGMTWDAVPEFYAGWTDDASHLYVTMDLEFRQLLDCIGVSAESIPPVLDYYGCSDVPSLTRKLSSIPAFQNIPAPMRALGDGRFVPDFSSRYFTEDFPFGMRSIVSVARDKGVSMPVTERVYQWGIRMTELYAK